MFSGRILAAEEAVLVFNVGPLPVNLSVAFLVNSVPLPKSVCAGKWKHIDYCRVNWNVLTFSCTSWSTSRSSNFSCQQLTNAFLIFHTGEAQKMLIPVWHAGGERRGPLRLRQPVYIEWGISRVGTVFAALWSLVAKFWFLDISSLVGGWEPFHWIQWNTFCIIDIFSFDTWEGCILFHGHTSPSEKIK